MSFETIKIKVSLGNNQVCKNPKILLVGYENLIINCIDETCGEYQVQFDNPLAEKCFTFSVTCENCKECPAQLIRKCLCDANTPCTDPCDLCDGGVCNPKPCTNGCQQGICLDDCIQCVDSCDGGKICSSYMRPDGKECKKCICPPGQYEDSFKQCKSCLTDSHCPKCFTCSAIGCIPKNCGIGKCDPLTGSCEGCINSGDCGVNQCCINKKCECCNGFVKDTNGNCVPKPPCTDDTDCGKCGICKKGNCVPRICPNNQGCDLDTGICKDLCDCNKPSSCGQNRVCKRKGTICLCESCGQCATGCSEGCIDKCDKGLGCVPNPCGNVLNPKSGADCGPDCGYNPLTGKCEPCSTQSCGTNCGNLLGCVCSGSIECIKDDSCSGSCSNGFDCGPNCTCYLGKCTPCSFFSCTDCSSQSKCKCNGQKCEGDPSAKCHDKLEIIKNDNCTITGKLSVTSDCGCPIITVKLNSTVVEKTNSLEYSFSVELFKGNTTEAQYRLDQVGTPGIATNEVPTNGSVEIDVQVNYDNNSIKTERWTLNTSGRGISDVVTKSIDRFGYNYGTDKDSKYVSSIVFNSNVGEHNFPNGCNYTTNKLTPAYYVQNNTTKYEGSTIMTSQDTKLPLFTWYKSSTGTFGAKLKDVYATKDVDGNYVNTLSSPDAESCNNYKLETDCGCSNPQVAYIAFCSPTSFTAEFAQCNTWVKVHTGTPCDANINKTYTIYAVVNNTPILIAKSVTLPFNSADYFKANDYISSVYMVMDCDLQNTCKWEVSAGDKPLDKVNAVSNCTNGSDPVLSWVADNISYVVCSIDGGITKHYPVSGKVLINAKSNTKYTYTVYFTGGCKPYTSSITTDNCPGSYALTAVPNCTTNKYTFGGSNNGLFDNAEYSLEPGFLTGKLLTKTQVQNLAVLDITGTLYYRILNSDVSSSTTLPAKSTCCTSIFTYVTKPSNGSLEVSVTNVSPNTITVNVNVGVVHSLTIASGITSSTTFTLPLAPYNGTIGLADGTCLQNISGTITNCSLPITTGSQGCSLTAVATASCDCKLITWETEITNIIKDTVNNKLVVGYASSVIVEDSEVVSGTVAATVATNMNASFGGSVDAKGFSFGIVEIPCDSHPSTSNGSIIVKHRVKPQDGYLNFVFSQFNAPGYTIDNLSVNGNQLTGVLGVYTYTYPANQQGIFEVLLQVKNTATGQVATTLFNTNNNTPSEYNKLTELDNSGGYEYNFTITESSSLCPSVSSIELTIKDLKLSDGCEYPDLPTKVNFLVNAFGVVITPKQKVTLTKKAGSVRKIKYVWSEDGKIITTNYQSSGVPSLYSGTTLNPITINKPYSIFGECGCSSSSVSVRSCLTMPTFTISNVSDTAIDFKIQGGCYTTPINVSIPGETPIQINHNPSTISTGTLAISTPIVGTVTLTGEYDLNKGCKFTIPVSNNNYEVIPTIVACATGGCAAGTYIYKLKVKKNGILLANTAFSFTASGGLTVSADVDGVSRKTTCATTAVGYTYSVLVDGNTRTGSWVNTCACTLQENSIAFNTPAPICNTATTTQINVGTPAPMAVEYNTGSGWSSLGGYITYTIPTPGVTSNVTIQVRDTANPTCIINKTIQLTYKNCDGGGVVIPPVDCSLSINSVQTAKITTTGSTTDTSGPITDGNIFNSAVTVNLGDSFTVNINTLVGGGTYTYSWAMVSTYGTVASITNASTATATFNNILTFGGDGNQLLLGCSVYSNGNCSRTFYVSLTKATPTCSGGQTYYPTLNGVGGCCNSLNYNPAGSGSCCPEPVCGTNKYCCSASGKVCDGTTCKIPNDICGLCKHIDAGTGVCVDDSRTNCQCCFNRHIVNIIDNIDTSMVIDYRGIASFQVSATQYCRSGITYTYELKTIEGYIVLNRPMVDKISIIDRAPLNFPISTGSNPYSGFIVTITGSNGCLLTASVPYSVI